MDVNIGVSVLRLHSQYVIQLATELSTTFSALEQAFKEQHEPLSTHVDGYSEKIAELQRLLATETTMFCRRVNAFTEQLRESRNGAALSFQADGAQLELEDLSSQQTLSKAFPLSHLARVLVENSRAAMASARQTLAHTRAVVQ